jgi:hypothetical protein
MKEILKDKYFERFNADEKMFDDKNNFKNKVQEKALITALDTRKFEIELYWKRATYFWAFIAAMFIAYFAVFNSDKINEIKGVTILISALGYFFSLGWYFVNRGSKYWQENWEAHVDLLGPSIQGDLFTTIKISNSNFWNVYKEYPFSVSKVNQFLSMLMTLTWFGLFIFSIFFSFDKLIYIKDYFEATLILLLGLLIGLTIWFFYKSKSFIAKHKKIKVNEGEAETDFFVKD